MRLLGFIINVNMAGMLKITHRPRQSIINAFLENNCYHFISKSEMHQKFGTFN
jgi:hypothetical protein